jgi:hypothetical protein
MLEWEVRVGARRGRVECVSRARTGLMGCVSRAQAGRVGWGPVSRRSGQAQQVCGRGK